MSAARVPVSLEYVSPQPLPQFLPERFASRAMSRVLPASQLADRPAPATVLTGIAELDRLTGGVPRGALSEICGPASSGRSSVLLALMVSMAAQAEMCALVDATDSFDPQSAEAAGVDLRRVLWVRCSKNRLAAGGRRSTAESVHPVAAGRRAPAMDSLEQALKATDLLLQGGGFGLVAVDLGDVPAQAARRVPLTSWFRFRRTVENTCTALVVIEQEPYAKTCASVVLRLSAVGSQLSACSGGFQSAGFGGINCGGINSAATPAHARILSGLEIKADAVRSAAQGKKPVRSEGARFTSRAQWAG
jgi:hypothetical protein